MISARWSISRRKLLLGVVIFIVYLLATKAGTLFYAGGRTSPAIIFPAAGVAIAALFLEGYSFWVVIALASLLNSYFSSTPLVTAIGIVIGSVIQALLGAYLLKRFKFDPRIWRFRDMGLMVGVSLLVTVIAPSVTTLMSVITNVWGVISPVQRWFSYWLGGILSVMLITPFLISWVTHPKLRASKKYFLETGAAFLVLVGITFLIYWTPYTSLGGVTLIYVLLVPLFWISLRFGNREAITALMIMAGISLTGIMLGWHGQPMSTLGNRLFQQEIFCIIISGIFFIVSAISEERRMAEATSRSYIAQLEEALSKLRAADAAKTEFIAVLAHELRNPLAPALSSLEFLELQEFSTPEKEEAALQAKRNIKSMSHLLDDLLDVSRITQGKIKLQKEPVNVAMAIDRVVRNTQLLIDSRRHKLSVAVPQDLPEVMADVLRLEQIVTNLLTNAAKYTPPDGKIWVTATVEGGDMVIKVADNGMGISQESLPSIFEMFNQANRHTSKSSEGLGIGLGLVKKLVELHDGSVVANSDGVGKGSEFTVRMPLGERPPISVPAAIAEFKPKDPEAKASKKKILIVDDNEAAANALVKLFTRLGHDARAVYRAKDGIQEALALRPDLILLDIGLPDMSGFDVAKKLRTHPELSGSLLVAVSGYGQEEDRQHSREAGFDHHLVKPVELDSWRALLEKV